MPTNHTPQFNPNIHSQITADPLLSLLGNLREVLDSEEQALASGRTDSLETYAREKLRILVNLNRITSEETSSTMLEHARTELQETRRRLDDNMRTLKFRIGAIGEIADTIESAVREADSDGTYEVGTTRNGRSK